MSCGKRQPRIPGTSSPRALFLLPEIGDHLPPELKNGLALRNAASVEGRCPSCGATPEFYPDPEYPGIFHAVFAHEPDCAALTDEAIA